MNWTEIDIYTTTEGIDPVCGCLLRIGITGFEIRDSKDLEDFLNDKTANWDYIDDDLMELKNCETCVTVYVAENEQGAETAAMIRSEMKALKSRDEEDRFGRLAVEMSGVREEDWANNWKQYFKPIRIGEKLLIKPSWEEPVDSTTRTILEIDPASSFGTGQHDTTKLCLEFVERFVKKDARQLDVGCGSGILSIAGILLGAREAYAVDTDENSTDIAAENAAKNDIKPDIYKTFCGNIIDDEDLRSSISENGKFDIITANIVADVLIAMSPIFGGFLADDGIIIISGIILERCDEVMNSFYDKGYKLIELRESEGWAAAAFRR